MRFSISITLLLLSTACSGNPGPELDAGVRAYPSDPLASLAWRAPGQDRECVGSPAEATPESLLDDASLLEEIALRGELTDGHVLWSVAFDDNGMLAAVRVLEQSPDTLAGPLEALLRRALRPQAGPTYARIRLDAVTMHADSAPLLRVRVGGTQYCPPTLRNHDTVARMLGAVDRRGRAVLILYIDQEGVVQEREIRVSSGDATTDGIALGLVGGMRYDAAYFERQPVPARILYEVAF